MKAKWVILGALGTMFSFADAAFAGYVNAAPDPTCSGAPRCLVSGIPITNSGLFNDSDVQITLINVTEFEQTADVKLYANNDMAIGTQFLAGFLAPPATLSCSIAANLVGDFLAQYKYCTTLPAYLKIPKYSTLHHTVHVNLNNTNNPRTSLMLKVEVNESKGALRGIITIHHKVGFGGVGASLGGVGIAGGAMDMTTHFNLNGDKPF